MCTSPRLRFFMNSGEHLPVPVMLQIREKFPTLEIYCVYGLTEVAGRLCVLSSDLIDSKTGSVGRPLPGMKVHIRDENGQVLPAKAEGEVYVEGVCLMRGYLNNEEANTKSLTPVGFATGDFGYLDEDGYLFIIGRHDDIIKVGGEKVSLKTIEEAIFGFECFDDFIVAPVYDDNMGHVPCVYYVLKEGMKFKRKELLKLLRQRLPSVYIPAYFSKVDEVPRSDSGKKLRRSATVFENRGSGIGK